MSTSVASITPQSAPRDPQALMKLGIFQLRLLIEKLGGLGDEKEKMAFAKMSTDEKVNLALQLLAHFDKAQGGHANGVSPGTMALPAPVMQVPSMEVNPAALAAAAQATAPQVQVRRSPVTKPAETQAPPASADLGSDIVNALNRIIAQNDETNGMIAGAMKELLSEVKNVAASNQGLNETYKAVYGSLQAMDRSINQVARQSALQMALILPLAEQVLGGSREEVLGATVGDLDTVQAMMTQMMNPGKAG